MAKKKYAFGGQAEAGMARRPTTAPAGKPVDRPTVKSPAMRAAPQAMQNAAAQSRLMRPTAMASGGGVKRELSDFEKAFAENRRKLGAGKTFEYNGKKYSTNRADDKTEELEEVSVPAPRPAPQAQKSRGASGSFGEPEAKSDKPGFFGALAARFGTEGQRKKYGGDDAFKKRFGTASQRGMASGGVPPTAANAAGASRGLDRAAAMSGRTMPTRPMKKGGAVRGDGCASKGKTKGRMV